nr:MAG TPA: hypothetical protein [Caudoviricetes sp.]
MNERHNKCNNFNNRLDGALHPAGYLGGFYS